MSTKQALVAGGIALLACGAMFGYFYYEYDYKPGKELEAKIEQINRKIEKDVNENTDTNLKSFSMNKIKVLEKDNQFVMYFNGKARTEAGKYQNNITVSYKLNEDDFIKLTEGTTGKYQEITKTLYSDVTEGKGFRDAQRAQMAVCRFINNVYQILYESEFLSSDVNNVAMLSADVEMSVEASKPKVDEKTGEVSYTLSLTKVENNNLKMADFKISAKLDNQLKANPSLIYEMKKEDLSVKKLNEIEHKNVDSVHKGKNSYLTIPQL